jgi:hypothetical protein
VADDQTLEAAERILAAAKKKAAEIHAKMDIAVVDAGANLKAFARMDGAWLGSVTEGVAVGLPTATPPKFPLPGVSSTGATPVPVKETVDGLVVASSVTVSVAVRIPSALG